MKAFLFLCVVSFVVRGKSDHPVGHLQPLGSHQDPEEPITELKEVPTPKEFFLNFVKPGRPVLFKGAAKDMPSFSLWTDEYLSKKFGGLKMDVEEGKKENRSWGTFNFKLQDFIKRYKTEDVYMVESLPKEMQEEYMLLKSLRCGGFTDVLQDAVMWFSSGGTKSVFHFDAVENVNCLFSGSKQFVMVDKKYKPQAHIDKVDGSYSTVDVEKVDMYKYPGLRNIPWYNVSMVEGDCLYIPYMYVYSPCSKRAENWARVAYHKATIYGLIEGTDAWLHHVHSYGTRNLAINIWWAHFTFFNESDCQTSKYKDEEFLPLSSFTFKPMETTRQRILEEIGRKAVTQEEWIKMSKKLANDFLLEPKTKEVLAKNFQELDKNKDGFVSADELLEVPNSEIDRLLNPGLHPEEEEEEEEEEKEGGGEDEESPIEKLVKSENERVGIKEDL